MKTYHFMKPKNKAWEKKFYELMEEEPPSNSSAYFHLLEEKIKDFIHSNFIPKKEVLDMIEELKEKNIKRSNMRMVVFRNRIYAKILEDIKNRIKSP